MASAKCGFDNSPGISGCDALEAIGPTLRVDVGFDPAFDPKGAKKPVAAIEGLNALVDTGASICCIDSALATALNLPIIDRQSMSGVFGGVKDTNMHLAQVHATYLGFTIYGSFAAVDLIAGGQRHQVLIGRSFLRHFTMTYEGRTGTVTLSND